MFQMGITERNPRVRKMESDAYLHSGSAGPMESKGAINIFSKSIEKYNLSYVHYIGDGENNTK